MALKADELRENAVKENNARVKNAMDEIMKLQVKVVETTGDERQKVFQYMLDQLNRIPSLRM